MGPRVVRGRRTIMKKELTLNKKTIVNLENLVMNKVVGGKTYMCPATLIGCECTSTSNRTDI